MILIAFGANLPSRYGDPAQTLKAAEEELRRRGVDILASSRIWKSAPVPFDDAQPWYYNAVISVETDLSPHELLALLLGIEQDFGRERSLKNAARILDLDLIAYHDKILNEPDLTLPHPRMSERAFVLRPLEDIAPAWVHPVSNKGLFDLILGLPTDQKIEIADD